ncbi:hypothetical protein SK128_002639 [Halocaridina rubra]|uniref:Uncharacterized protein n=1 Tax=Halocaridina rubra TaxID=373956 RepID=A0AAN8X645_HALRR
MNHVVAFQESNEESQVREKTLPVTENEVFHPSSRKYNQMYDYKKTYNGFSFLAIISFGAFVKYLVYHFIISSAAERRSFHESLLDLTRIINCITEDKTQPNLQLHCFFPSYFSMKDNDIVGKFLWGSSSEDLSRTSNLDNENIGFQEGFWNDFVVEGTETNTSSSQRKEVTE